MNLRFAYWVLVAATAVVYVYLVFAVGAHLKVLAGGQEAFDLRLSGYAMTDVQAYMSAMAPETPDYYTQVVRRVDTAFPVMFTAVLSIAIWFKTGGAQRAFVFLPIAYGVFDLFENAAISAMLEAGPDGLTPEIVGVASRLTILKFATLGLAMLALARGLIRRRAVA